MLLISPLLAGVLAKLLGMYAVYLPDSSMGGRVFSAIGEYWLFIVILSLIVNVAAAAISEGGGY